MKIAHVAYQVQDLAASLHFYCSQLGFKEAFRLNHPETGALWIVYLQVSGEQFLELFPTAGPLAAGTRYHHLCLQTDDLAGTVAQLEARGVTIRQPITRGLDKNLQAWIADPDGNPVELMQIHPESPQALAARAQLQH